MQRLVSVSELKLTVLVSLDLTKHISFLDGHYLRDGAEKLVHLSNPCEAIGRNFIDIIYEEYADLSNRKFR